MDSKELRLFREAYGSIYSTQKEETISESECEDEDEMEEEKPSKKGKKDKKEEVAEGTVAEEQLDEMVPALQEPVEKVLKKTSEFMKKNPVGRAIGKAIEPVGKGRPTATSVKGAKHMRDAGIGQSEKPTGLNNSADLFDIVKGHLLDEGYADTEEAALAIMANMSEEWRQSIIESGYFPTPESQREDEKKYNLSRDRLPGEHKPQKPQKPQSQKPGM